MKKIALLFSWVIIFNAGIENECIAGWSSISNPIFTPQKDVVGNLDTYSHASGSIYYGGQGYVFINHNVNGVTNTNYISWWKLTNTSGVDAIPKWGSDAKEVVPDSLKQLDLGAWQPAPVIFDDVLYLFVKKDSKVKYSIYNQGAGAWSALRNGPTECFPSCMAAATVGDYLCLVTMDASNNNLVVKYTRDMVKWESCSTAATVGQNNLFSNDHLNRYCISAIPKTYFDQWSGKLSTKLMVGYIDIYKHAQLIEFTIDSTGKMSLSGGSKVADDMEYTSIALAEGTVKGNQGICTQAFLKKASKDNGYCRYRILRYTKAETSMYWSLSENNIVTQNSPKMWADQYLNLTAIIVPVFQANKDCRQYMCLIYRGYDDWDHPMNSAWAETDYYRHTGDVIADKSDNDLLKTYVGYVEGPPPYYLNPPSDAVPGDPYVNDEDVHISSAVFTHSEGSATEENFKWKAGIKGTVKGKVVSGALGEKFGQNFQNITETENSYDLNIWATKGSKGKYLYFAPRIARGDYMVRDMSGQDLYKTYYFYNMGVSPGIEEVDLAGGLVPGKPETYYNRSAKWAGLPMYGLGSTTWIDGAEVNSSVKVTESHEKTWETTTTIKIDFKFLKIFNIGVDGSFNYETTTTTTTGNEVECIAHLNPPREIGDLENLDYDFYWLKPSGTSRDWWVPGGLIGGQSPWCLTYNVTSYKYCDKVPTGSIKNSTKTPDSVLPEKKATTGSVQGNYLPDPVTSGIALFQNFPNPFSSSTTIRYNLDAGDFQKGGATGSRHVVLAVYDMNGKRVASLVNGYQAPGNYEVVWLHSGLCNGFYICSLVYGNEQKNIKMQKTD